MLAGVYIPSASRADAIRGSWRSAVLGISLLSTCLARHPREPLRQTLVAHGLGGTRGLIVCLSPPRLQRFSRDLSECLPLVPSDLARRILSSNCHSGRSRTQWVMMGYPATAPTKYGESERDPRISETGKSLVVDASPDSDSGWPLMKAPPPSIASFEDKSWVENSPNKPSQQFAGG